MIELHNMTIQHAEMHYSKEEGYVGRVRFEVAGHRVGYELTLLSKRGKDWSYGLHFAAGGGVEAEIFAVEEALETDDALYEGLIEAARAALPGKEAVGDNSDN